MYSIVSQLGEFFIIMMAAFQFTPAWKSV